MGELGGACGPFQNQVGILFHLGRLEGLLGVLHAFRRDRGQFLAYGQSLVGVVGLDVGVQQLLVHPASRFVLRIFVGELLLEGQLLCCVFLQAGLLEQLPFRRGGIEFREFVALRPCGRGSECDGEKGSDSFHGYLPDLRNLNTIVSLQSRCFAPGFQVSCAASGYVRRLGKWRERLRNTFSARC